MKTYKKIVGLVPSAKLFKNDDPYSDKYEFVNSYVKRIEEVGGNVLGILPNDGYISQNSLDICDSFVISGGLQIHPYHFQVVEHCYNTGKKLLGVCLGLQTIHSFFTVLDERKKINWQGSLLDLYSKMKKEKYMFVLPVNGHWQHNITRDSIDQTKHAITIEKNSLVYDIFQKETMYVSSMHNYAINGCATEIRVSAISNDNSIEAIEYNKNILGVQFHPEVNSDLNNIFKFVLS